MKPTAGSGNAGTCEKLHDRSRIRLRQKAGVCASALRLNTNEWINYPACNAHAPYCRPWPVWLYHIFQHVLIKGTTFERGKVLEHKMRVLVFSTTFTWNSYHYEKKCKSVFRSSRKVPITVVRFYGHLNFLDRFFEKYSNVRLHENPFSGSRVAPLREEGRTDRRTDVTKLKVASGNFAILPKISTFCPHTVFMCFVWIWEQRAIISLYSINWLVFVREA